MGKREPKLYKLEFMYNKKNEVFMVTYDMLSTIYNFVKGVKNERTNPLSYGQRCDDKRDGNSLQ